MGLNIRAKLASKISRIDEPQYYLLNKFLYANKSKRIDPEEFFTDVLDTSDIINIEWKDTQTDRTYYFYAGVNQGSASYIYFTSANITAKFFAFPKPDSTVLGFEKLEVETQNLKKYLNYPESRIINFKEDVFPNVEVWVVKTTGLISTTHNIELWEDKNKTAKYEAKLKPPATKEYLSTFVPEIKKLSLLNPKELLNDSYIDESDSIDRKIEFRSPRTKSFNNFHVINDYPMMFYQNFDFPVPTSTLISTDQIEIFTKADDRIEESKDLLEVEEFNILHKFLEPTVELSEEAMEEILFGFPEYVKEGAKFLYGSNLALLNDSLELEKELQAVLAVKMLLKLRVIGKILIVTHSFKEKLMVSVGPDKQKSVWQANIQNHLSNYSSKFYPDTYFLATDQHFDSTTIHGMTYDVFRNCYENDPSFFGKLNKFDCIIVDELTEEIMEANEAKLLLKKTSPSYMWMLTNGNPNFQETIENIFFNNELNYLGREKFSVELPVSKRFNLDYYLDIDESNKEISNDIYELAQKKLDDIVQFGSILRLQPNALHFIQDSQRKNNFIGDSCRGNKTELLKYHLKQIFEHTNRILIYSQFEQMGITQISEILTEMNIEFTIFRQLDSTHDINEKLNIGENFNGKLVYLTNFNPIGIKFNFPNVSYLINFDNWWNPLIRWTLENKLEFHYSERITVYNYYYNDSLESRLFSEMTAKGLTDKNIIEDLERDKFNLVCDDKFWGTFFNLPYEIFNSKEEEPEINSMDKLVEKISKLMNFVGYKLSASHKGEDSSTYYISGLSSNNGGTNSIFIVCKNSKSIDADFINSITATKNIDSKIWIVTNGEINYENIVFGSGISFIDGKKLKTYCSLFGL